MVAIYPDSKPGPLSLGLRPLLAKFGLSRVAPISADKVINGPDAIFAVSETVQFRVPISLCRSYYNPGFGPSDGHPLRDAAAIYASTGSREAMRRFLAAHYDAFQPRNLAEALFRTNDPSLAPLTELSPYALFQPWRLETRISTRNAAIGSQNFGPVSAKKLRLEVRKISNYTDSLRAHGYRPELYAKRAIQGYFLIHGEDYRFIVTNGVHRTCILSVLGEETIIAEFDPRRARIVDASQMRHWPQVKSGYCPEPVAARFVARLTS